MDENKTIINEQSVFDEELYQKNRQRFLRMIKVGLGVMVLLLLAAGGLWYWQYKTDKDKKASLNSFLEETQKKHEELQKQGSTQPSN